MIVIDISKEFSKTIGGRYESEGEYSGESFRKKILSPKYKEAVKNEEKIKIILDGCYGYPSSFLEEAFGGLARELKDKNIYKNMILVCEDEPSLIDNIKNYILKAW